MVLAGGRSTRFGGEKAVALLDGRPLLLWAVDRLRSTCADIAVNARPGTQTEALALAQGLPVLHDAPGDPDGPLAGVKAGLAWAASLGATALAGGGGGAAAGEVVNHRDERDHRQHGRTHGRTTRHRRLRN